MTPEKIFIQSSLYEQFDITELTYKEIFNSVFTDKSIDTFCIDCNDKSIFLPFENYPTEDLPSPHGIRKKQVRPETWFDFSKYSSSIHKEFKCSRDQSHRLHFYFFIVNQKLIKIGQFPSVADLTNYEIKLFQKVLGNDYYKEFNKAIGLFSHGVGVGSFVYLRRIIENFIIKPAHEKAKQSSSWDEVEFEKKRAKEKINALKVYLPEFLVYNKEIYSILSKGIHELKEEDCIEIFPVLKSCLILILTEVKAEREKLERKKELEQTIKDIHQKHK